MKPASSQVYKTTHLARHEALEGMPLASFKSRAFAIAIDALIVGAVLLLFRALLGSDATDSDSDDTRISVGFHGFASFLVFTLYFGIATALGNGATPGKRLLGIRVVSTVHEHMSFWHSLERALGYSASSLEAGFGFLQFFTHPNRQTVHDRIAETIVIDARARPAAGGAAS
jgi:uncharacterized RDD family membrane protein YckC